MASKTTPLSKQYYSLDEAVTYLSDTHNDTFNHSDIINEALRGNIKLCFFYDGQLGIYSDPYADNQAAHIGEHFNFSGYLSIIPSDLSSNDPITATRVEIVDTFPSSDTIPPLEKDYYFYGEAPVDDGKGNEYGYPILIPHDKLVLTKDDLELINNSFKTANSSSQASNDLPTTERNTLYKIILGMAIAKYDYDPDGIRNTATGNNIGSIAVDLQTINRDIEVSNDTIKKHLDAAKELLL